MCKDTSFGWLLSVARSEVRFRSIIVCGTTDEAALMKMEVKVTLDFDICDGGMDYSTNESHQYKLRWNHNLY
jgi:hypothetical protein